MTDESLHTLFCEVAHIINRHPLTKVSDDVTDAAPFTHNHLLLLRGSTSEALDSSLPNDVFQRDGILSNTLLEYLREDGPGST